MKFAVYDHIDLIFTVFNVWRAMRECQLPECIIKICMQGLANIKKKQYKLVLEMLIKMHDFITITLSDGLNIMIIKGDLKSRIWRRINYHI